MDKAAGLATSHALPTDEVEFFAVLLAFVGIVILCGLFLAWRYRRMERRREPRSYEQRKAQRAAEPVVMPSVIETRDAIHERATALRINLQDESRERDPSAQP
jgi:heme/copper-type cytochrome/quinol oxidase subunit 2